jgi:hypothetical protein
MSTPDIARFRPFDGLFLRAVHLDQIQLYAQGLAHALGQGGGPGIVHGFGVKIETGGLAVEPGLAIAADGRALLSSTTIHVPLPKDGATLASAIVLSAKDRPYGEENAYGEICVDPCGGTTSQHAFVEEIVDVTLKDLTVAPEVDAGALSFRNRVASWYFEQERTRIAPMIAASDRDRSPGALLPSTGWVAPALGATDDVCAGLLLRSQQGFLLDVWAGRRDRLQNPPHTSWMRRLAMRPWAIWEAQLLQFQDQLMAVWPIPVGVVSAQTSIHGAERADLTQQLRSAYEQMAGGRLREPKNILRHSLAVLEGAPSAPLTFGLPDLGFDDLPPAGYLPIPPNQIYSHADTLFPEQIQVSINAYRADEIVEMVERTQHLDRIPLTPNGGGAWPVRIEIMVPVTDPFTDGHDLQSERTWVAFRRAQHVPTTPEGQPMIQPPEPPVPAETPQPAEPARSAAKSGEPKRGATKPDESKPGAETSGAPA